MGTGKRNPGDNPAMDYHPILGGVKILTSYLVLQKPG